MFSGHNHKILHISFVQYHSLINSPDNENCNTILFLLLSFQYFHVQYFGDFFNHILYACNKFSLLVQYSKFSSLLSVFMPFLWFTCKSEGHTKASITSLWTCFDTLLYQSRSDIWQYQNLILSFISLFHFPIILPISLALYQGNQGISFQTSFSIFLLISKYLSRLAVVCLDFFGEVLLFPTW